ncbi:MAG: ferritin-like protein [Chloroflexi bacterium]|nr:ferritin-like protein [Chloroflexota bacterium]
MSSSLYPVWDIQHLQDHLQYAVDLEFWTVPFYMSAMYSIKDPSDKAYRLIQSIVYEEMLHMELASNVANAYGKSPVFNAPSYQGTTIPHLEFDIDTPDPRNTFTPYSAEIGPLDQKRINAMCLIEYPEWDTGHEPNLQENTQEYGSIGEFYEAVRVGATELVSYIQGGQNQIDFFQRYYSDFAQQTITREGKEGLKQVMNLINAITEQGEGQTQGHTEIPEEYRNTADGFEPSWSHYTKFIAIRDSHNFPETYSGHTHPNTEKGKAAQLALINSFTNLRETLQTLFSGGDQGQFWVQMTKVGGDILTCWKSGAIPRFS